MQTKILGLLAAVVILVAGLGVYIYTAQVPASTSASNASDTAVRAFVTDFGSKFKNVSLLADNKSAQLNTEYAAYVSPELLAAWQSGTAEAPGRQTSSPWPDHINVVSVTEKSPNMFAVEGNIIEVTSADASNTPAAVQPVSMIVEKRNDSFVITSFSKGAYSDLPQQVTVVGNWECLPHKDTSGPQTLECAFGIAKDQSDGHYAIDTSLMAQYPVDFPTGTKVRVQGVLVPAEQLNSVQKYDIDGVIQATSITKVTASGGKLMSIDSYVTQNISTLSPVKATLGGTFQVTSLDAQNGKGTVNYEDGHNAYVADFTYTVSDTATGAGNIQVTSFKVRP